MPAGAFHIPRRLTPDQIEALFVTQRAQDRLGYRIHLILGLGACFMAGWSTAYVEWAALPVLICFLIRMTGWHRMLEPLAFDRVVRLLLLWGAWVGLSVLWSEAPGPAWLIDIRTFRFLALPIILWPVMDRRSWLIAAVIAGIACGQLSQLLHLVGTLTGASWIPYHRNPGRISGWWDPVSGGTVLCAGLGLWLAPAMWGATSRARWIGTLGSLATLASLALTGTRGAWIGAAALIPIAMLLRLWRRDSRRAMVWPFGACVATACILVAGAAMIITQQRHDTRSVGIVQRIHSGIDEVRNGFGPEGWRTDTGMRIAMWRWAAAEWRTHPLIGVGAGGYQPWVRAKTPADADRLGAPSGAIPGVHAQAHSWFLHTLATLGTVGFVLLMALLITSILAGLEATSPLAMGWFARCGLSPSPALALIALACAGLFDTITVNQQPSYLFFLFLALCLPSRPREAAVLA